MDSDWHMCCWGIYIPDYGDQCLDENLGRPWISSIHLAKSITFQKIFDRVDRVGHLYKMFVHLGRSKSSDADSISQCSSMKGPAAAHSQETREVFGNGWKHAAPSYGLPMQCHPPL